MVDTEIDASVLISEFLNEDMACEEETHGVEKDIHDEGPGVWYVTMHCKWCEVTEIALFCNKFYSLLKGLPDNWEIEHSCGKQLQAGEALVNAVRRNGKRA